jgi:hypothetical protein
MFFTKAGSVVAWVFFVPCALAYAPIILAAWTGQLSNLAEVTSVGYVQSQGEFMKGILVGVAFGIASEMSKSVAGKNS